MDILPSDMNMGALLMRSHISSILLAMLQLEGWRTHRISQGTPFLRRPAAQLSLSVGIGDLPNNQTALLQVPPCHIGPTPAGRAATERLRHSSRRNSQGDGALWMTAAKWSSASRGWWPRRLDLPPSSEVPFLCLL
jgi:hypothetical protein